MTSFLDDKICVNALSSVGAGVAGGRGHNPVPAQGMIIRQSLHQFRRFLRSTAPRLLSSTPQASPLIEQQLPPSFWPSGPPTFHRDKAIKAEAEQIYSKLTTRYWQLRKVPREKLGDPWGRREEWRYHPYFGPVNVIKNALPGFSWAIGAFIVYCAYEKATKGPSESNHH